MKTSNYYLGAAKQFGKWLMRDQRLPENPFVHVQGINASSDLRRERRALTAEVFARLIEVTQKGAEPFRGLSGRDRAVLYSLAAYTGLRAAELASLKTSSLNLDCDPPTVTVEAAYSKHRRRDVLPLRSDLATVLRDWLERTTRRTHRTVVSLQSKADSEKWEGDSPYLWPGTWQERSARMLRADLDAAGIPYTDDAGRVFDFHALRHHFISNLATSGVHPKVAQTLARHSTITLTMDRYTHVMVTDIASALDQLPDLPSQTPGGGPDQMRATGTDGRAVNGRTEVTTGVPRGAIRPASYHTRFAPDCTERVTIAGNEARPENAKKLRKRRSFLPQFALRFFRVHHVRTD